MLKKLQDYINARIALLGLEIIEKTSKGVTFLILAVMLTIFFMLFLVFGSIALAFAIGNEIGSIGYGFAIISGFYLILFLIILIFRKSLIEKPALDYSVKYLFEKNEDEQEE